MSRFIEEVNKNVASEEFGFLTKINFSNSFLLKKSSIKFKMVIFLFFCFILMYHSQGVLERYNNSYQPNIVKNAGVLNWLYVVNHGYPFYFYTGATDKNQVDTSALLPYHKVWGDYGSHFTISLVSVIFSKLAFLGTHEFVVQDQVILLYVLFILISIIFLIPKFPRFLIICSQITLLLTIFKVCGEYTRVVDFRYLDALAAVMAAMFLITLVLDRKNILFYILLGLISGWLQLYRQTMFHVFSWVFMGTFVTIGMCYLTHFIKSKFISTQKINIPLRELVLPCCSVMGCFIGVKLFVVLVYCLAYNSFSFSNYPGHGSGQPLYLSLGYASNPYALAWEDDTSYINYRAIFDQTKPDFQKDLLKEYWRIVFEDPMLLVKNIAVKATVVHNYILNHKITPENGADIAAVSPQILHVFFYYLMYIIIGLQLWKFIFAKKHTWEQIFITINLIVLILASTAAPLLVFPGYYAGFIGCLFSIALLIGPAFLYFDKLKLHSEHNNIDRKHRSYFLYLFILCLGFVVMFILYRFIINTIHSKALLGKDPVTMINSMDYKFGYLFNRLNIDEQNKVIKKIMDSGPNSNVFCVKSKPTDLANPEVLFNPVCLIKTNNGTSKNNAHFIVWFSDKWRPFMPPSDQGPANSVVTVSMFGGGKLEYNHENFLYQRVSDNNWNGKYYLFTLPMYEPFAKNVESLIAEGRDIVGLNTLGYVTRVIPASTNTLLRLDKWETENSNTNP